MTKLSAKDAVINIDDIGGVARNLSTDITSYDIEEDAGAITVTGFGDGSENKIPGLPIVGLTFEFSYDNLGTSGATTVLRGILNSNTSKTVTVKPDPAGQTLTGEYMLDGLHTVADPQGNIKHGSCHFSVMGATKPTWGA